jgi:hypothetical protein
MVRFRNIRSVKPVGVSTQIMKVTCLALECLLIHMFPTHTTTVMTILVQPRAELAVC